MRSASLPPILHRPGMRPKKKQTFLEQLTETAMLNSPENLCYKKFFCYDHRPFVRRTGGKAAPLTAWKLPIKEPLKGSHVTLRYSFSNHRTSGRDIRFHRHCWNLCMDRARAVCDLPRAFCDFAAIQGTTTRLTVLALNQCDLKGVMLAHGYRSTGKGELNETGPRIHRNELPYLDCQFCFAVGNCLVENHAPAFADGHSRLATRS